jgi:D,D-heptose 1,7-bisphosphate phosphatase
MLAVILAGGLGTRLKDVVSSVPKPMAPVDGRPFLFYILELLKESGISDVLMLTGHKGEIIEDYFQDGSDFGLSIRYSREPMALGTGGALFHAWSKLDEEFLLVNGDTIFDVQLPVLLDFVAREKSPACLALRFTDDVSRFGTVEIDNRFSVLSFAEKGGFRPETVDGFINGGISYFRKSALLRYFAEFQGKPVSLENQVFPSLSREGELSGIPMGGRFLDIGIPSDYERCASYIVPWLRMGRKPALFLDRDGVIIEDPGYVHGSDLTFMEGNFERTRLAKEQGNHIIVVSNQAGIAKGKFSLRELELANAAIGTRYKERGMAIDRFYWCPYHPEGVIDTYKKVSLARKPQPGMILRACEEFRIDIRNSTMIGDNGDVDRILLPGLSCEIV